jgi:hypothetical protein
VRAAIVLALAAGQPPAALADPRVEAHRQALDDRVDTRGAAGRGDCVVARARLSHRDVVADSPVEHGRLLIDPGDRAPQVVDRERADVSAVDCDRAGVGVVEPGSNRASVDLPEPLSPTIASVEPTATSRSMPRSVGRSSSCAKSTPRNSIGGLMELTP